MRVLFITSRLEPYTKNDAQAHVCATLARALKRSSHDVNVFAPFTDGSEHAGHSFARKLNPVRVDLFGKEFLFDVYTARTPAAVNHTLLRVRNAEAASDAERALAFSKAVHEFIASEGQSYDVAHAHGLAASTFFLWSSLRDAFAAQIATIYDGELLIAPHIPLVTHVSAVQSLVSAGDLEQLGVQGVLKADAITVLSAEEQRSVTQALRPHAKEPILVISVGLDTALWNPAVDPNLSARFDPYHLDSKWLCRGALQKELGLPVRGDVPLIGLAGIGDAGQLLIQSFAESGPDILQNNLQVAIMQFTHAQSSPALRELEQNFPDKLKVQHVTAGSSLEHRLAGACDAFLLPPLSPTEQHHLIALRYGCLPIVPAGSIASHDIVDCDPQFRTGSGLVYEGLSAPALRNVLGRLCAGFQNQEAYRALQSKIMLIDHSWQRAIRRYERLYDRSAASAA